MTNKQIWLRRKYKLTMQFNVTMLHFSKIEYTGFIVMLITTQCCQAELTNTLEKLPSLKRQTLKWSTSMRSLFVCALNHCLKYVLYIMVTIAP